MTNGEKIRNWSDESLASELAFMRTHCGNCLVHAHANKRGICPEFERAAKAAGEGALMVNIRPNHEKCTEQLLKWLREEAIT